MISRHSGWPQQILVSVLVLAVAITCGCASESPKPDPSIVSLADPIKLLAIFIAPAGYAGSVSLGKER